MIKKLSTKLTVLVLTLAILTGMVPGFDFQLEAQAVSTETYSIMPAGAALDISGLYTYSANPLTYGDFTYTAYTDIAGTTLAGTGISDLVSTDPIAAISWNSATRPSAYNSPALCIDLASTNTVHRVSIKRSDNSAFNFYGFGVISDNSYCDNHTHGSMNWVANPISAKIEGYRGIETTPAYSNTVNINGLYGAVSSFTAGTGWTNIKEIRITTTNTSSGNILQCVLADMLYSMASLPTATTGSASSISSTGATINGSVNDNGAATTVTFQYGTTASYGTTVSATIGGTLSAGQGNTAVAVSLSGLSPNTTYHYRVVGVTAEGTTNGDDATFTTSAVTPTVNTSAATSITSTGATINGSINANNASTVVTFEYGTTTGYGSIATAGQSPISGTTATPVSCSLSGLLPNTTYHYRVVGVNAAGTTNGLDSTFTTSAVAPTVSTNAATSITSTGATINGSINANNASTVVTFEYGTTTGYGSIATAGQSPISGTTATPVSCSLSGLLPNTTYHYRVVGVNTAGTTNGLDSTFTTSAIVPTVSTTAATSITSTGATINGSINANNASTIVTFEYGTTTGYGSIATASQSPISGTTATPVSCSLSGLLPNTTYHYRAVGVNTAGTTNGLDGSFTTSAVVPTVSTNAATSVTSTGATLNGMVNANNSSTAVTFEYGETSSYGTSVTVLQSPLTGTTGTMVSYTVTGLTPNTTYHYRVIGVNTAGTTNGDDATFTTSAIASSVTTQEVTSISATTATGNGNITSLGVPNPTQYGVVWNTTGMPTTADSKTSQGTVSSAGAFTSSMTGLTANTTYYVRAYATNTAGTSYGGEVSFTTLPVAPTITTQPVSSITATTALGNGNIISLGAPNPTQYGIVWNTTGTPTIADSKTSQGTVSSTGAFTSSMTGLTANTTYYVRTYATNAAGTSYGEEVSFTTLPVTPNVTTQTVSDITATTATGNGNITDLGVPNPTQYGVVWNTTGMPTTSDSKTTQGAPLSTGAFTSYITGLSPNTTYYVRAYSTNTAGTIYGTQVSFTTLNRTVTGTPENALNEENLNGMSITLTVSGDTFSASNGPIDPSKFTLNNKPAGLMISGANKTDSTNVVLTFAFDGTDFDSGITSFNITVNGTVLTGGNNLTTGNMNIAATTETAPEVTTGNASSIGQTTVTLGGNVTASGGENVTETGMIYSTIPGFLPGDAGIHSAKTGTAGTGSYTVNLSGLTHNTTYYFKAYATNSVGTSYGNQSSFSTEANAAPTDISLTSESIAENLSAGTIVGELNVTDVDSVEPFTYTMTDNAGYPDNGAFTITGKTLKTAAEFNYENKNSYNIKIRVTDSSNNIFDKTFTITVANANDAPSDIALSNLSVAENTTSGSVVGTFTTTDQDTSETFEYTLVSGNGDTDNSRFVIDGDVLKLAVVPDYETKGSYSIRVKSTDSGMGNLYTEKTFIITITNENEAPTNIELSNKSIVETASSGSTVGSLSTTDQDTGNTFTYTLVGGAGGDDNASFQISGSTLITAASFSYNTKNNFNIRIRATDGEGLYYEKEFIISITEVNAAPSDITLSNSNIAENLALDSTVGTLSTTDQNHGDTSFTYSLVSGNGSDDNASFTISEDKLKLAVIADYEVKDSYNIRIRSTDAGGLYYEKQFIVAITDANEMLVPSGAVKAGTEDNAVSFSNTDFVFSDPDGDSLTKIKITSLPANGTLKLNNTNIAVAQEIDAADIDSITFLPKVNWSGATSFTWQGYDGTMWSAASAEITINIAAVNDAPEAVGANISANVDTTVNGTLPASDVDGDALTYEVVSQGTKGIITITNNSTGEFTYTPEEGKIGSDIVTFKVYDQSLYSNIATLNFSIIPAGVADLSSISIDNLTISPAFDMNTLTYTANVENSISSLGVTASLLNKYSTLKIGDTQVTVTGPLYQGSKTIDLLVGSNKIDIEVTAQDGVTKKTYTLMVTRRAASIGGSSSSDDSVTSSGVEVLINGRAENAGTATTKSEGDKIVTTVVVDEKKLEQKLQSEGINAVVTIPVNTKSDVAIGELTGQAFKTMEKKQAVLEVKTEVATYTLPAAQINIDAISAQIGTQVQLQDIKVSIEIAKVSNETVKIVENAAETGKFTIVAPPIEFTVKCTNGDKTVSISNFNAYVERTIAIPDGVELSKITTGVVVDPDGSVRHVPTRVVKIDGKYYAKINSLTNSNYSVIWHPLEFQDAEKHWAKEAINDMGSRMVISGVGNDNFEPDRTITRAEFAAIVIKGLGLKPSTGKDIFTDVSSEAWYCGFVESAYEYGIISGYGNGKFGPNDKITREQAMTMIARAMKITGLKSDLIAGEDEKLLEGYGDYKEVADWARERIAICVKTGIVLGKSGKMLASKDEITRAEVAVIVKKLLEESGLI